MSGFTDFLPGDPFEAAIASEAVYTTATTNFPGVSESIYEVLPAENAGGLDYWTQIGGLQSIQSATADPLGSVNTNPQGYVAAAGVLGQHVERIEVNRIMEAVIVGVIVWMLTEGS